MNAMSMMHTFLPTATACPTENAQWECTQLFSDILIVQKRIALSLDTVVT